MRSSTLRLGPGVGLFAAVLDGGQVASPAVTQVTLDLTRDGWHGERRELLALAGIEAVDRVHQPDRADLDQVLELRAAAAVAPGKRLD